MMKKKIEDIFLKTQVERPVMKNITTVKTTLDELNNVENINELEDTTTKIFKKELTVV